MIILLPFKVLAFLVVAQRPCHQIRGRVGGGGGRGRLNSLFVLSREERGGGGGGIQHRAAVDSFNRRHRMKPWESVNPRCCFQTAAGSDVPAPRHPSLLPPPPPFPICDGHTRTWLGRKRRVLICKISFGNSTPLPWMSDRQSKLYWDPLRDDRWDLSLRAWRGAAGDTWYVIRRWCHGCRWLPPPPPPPLHLSGGEREKKWQRCEQLTENFYLSPSVWSPARWSWTPAIATFMAFKKEKKRGVGGMG